MNALSLISYLHKDKLRDQHIFVELVEVEILIQQVCAMSHSVFGLLEENATD